MGRFLFNVTKIEEDLLTLMSVINASEINHKITDVHVLNDKIYTIFYTEWDIIEEKIISTAIQLRKIDDRFKEYNKTLSIPFKDVGILLEKNVKKPLELWQSYNKIIHATEFTPHVVENQKYHKQMYSFYQPFITFKGMNWSAKLDVNKYIINGLSLLMQYDDDWDISKRMILQ